MGRLLQVVFSLPLLLVASLSLVRAGAGNLGVTVRLRPVEESYVLGEPIAVELAIRNVSAGPLELAFAYPDYLGVRFRCEDKDAIPTPPTTAQCDVSVSIIRLLDRLAPEEERKVVLALASYIQFRKPKVYHVHYEAVYTDEQWPPPKDMPSYSASGTIQVAIRPGLVPEAHLEGLVAVALEGQGRQKVSEAVELLCWTRDDRAIPFLERAAGVLMVNAGVRVVEALGRFPESNSAREALFRVAERGNWTALARAYQVCVRQQIPIPEDFYRRGVSSKDYWKRSATLHHLREYGHPSHLRLVRRAQSDGEPYLVNLAREVEAAIVRRAEAARDGSGSGGSVGQAERRPPNAWRCWSATRVVAGTIVAIGLIASCVWVLVRRTRRRP